MMVDKMQATGSSATSITSWYSSSGGQDGGRCQSHDASGRSGGGNFLYEDGRVNCGGLIWRITRRPSTSARRRAGGWFFTSPVIWGRGLIKYRMKSNQKRMRYVDELLVVIAIMRSLPGCVARAREGEEKAKGIQCLNNSKQLALSYVLYAGDQMTGCGARSDGCGRAAACLDTWSGYLVARFVGTVYQEHQSHRLSETCERATASPFSIRSFPAGPRTKRKCR